MQRFTTKESDEELNEPQNLFVSVFLSFYFLFLSVSLFLVLGSRSRKVRISFQFHLWFVEFYWCINSFNNTPTRSKVGEPYKLRSSFYCYNFKFSFGVRTYVRTVKKQRNKMLDFDSLMIKIDRRKPKEIQE